MKMEQTTPSLVITETEANDTTEAQEPFLPPPIPQLPYGSKISHLSVEESPRSRSKSLDVVSLHILPEIDEKDCGNDGGIERPIVVTGWRRYLGVGYTIICVNMLSLATTIFKKYSHLHPFNVGIWSSPAAIFLTTVTIFYTLFWEKKSVTAGLFPIRKHKKDLFFLWFRAVLSSVISYLTLLSFKYVSAADTRTVVSAAVIVVYFFGWMFLGEKCGVVPILVSLVALVGIGIMTRPPALTGAKEFDTNTLIEIGLASATTVVISMNLVIIRYLNKIHHGVTNLFVYVWGLAQGLILAFAMGVFDIPPLMDILGLTIAGVFLALALAFLVLALQLEEAGVVALVRTSEVIFVFFWQMVIVGTYPDLISVLGATLVISGVVAVSLRKWVSSLPEDNPKKKQLGFLLL